MNNKENTIIINSGATKTKLIIDGADVSKFAVDVTITIRDSNPPKVNISNYSYDKDKQINCLL